MKRYALIGFSTLVPLAITGVVHSFFIVPAVFGDKLPADWVSFCMWLPLMFAAFPLWGYALYRAGFISKLEWKEFTSRGKPSGRR